MPARLLDIIVTHYNEQWETVRPFFDILRCQKNVDYRKFKVWLIHDGYDTPIAPPSEYIRDHIPFAFEQIYIHHAGVSVARNTGLALADAEWVCFCDCDDCFSSIYSLKNILYILEQEDSKKFDLMWNKFYMDGLNGYVTVHDKFNRVFIHNKYYRLSFLREHNIKFEETLHMSEDSAFNNIIYLEIDPHKTGEINTVEPLYAWCRRPGSITMDFSKWIYNTEGHFDRNLYVIEQCRKRNILNGINNLIARVVTDVYSMLNKTGVSGDAIKLLKRASDFYKENKEAYLSVPEIMIKQALEASDKDVSVSQENKDSRPPLDQWIKDNLE